MPRLLDENLLSEFESRWRDLGTTMTDRMAPGLTDFDIDQITAPLGLSIPEELRRLYRWHNGSGLATMIWGRGMSSLAQSVTDTLAFREDDDEWKPGWVNIMDERPYVIVDCSVGPTDPAPVWHYGYAWDYPTRPVFASIGNMVAFWIELIDDGHMYWDAGDWKMRHPLSDDILQRLSGVPAD